MYHATHRIPTINVERFFKAIATINRKIDKARIDGAKLSAEVVKTELVEIDSDNNLWDEFSWITVRGGEQFRLNGYRFVARYDFERDVDGNPVCHIHAVPGEDVPAEFVETDGHCDHCNTRRFRANTFLVVNEDGAYEVFGRACLRDIFPITPAALAKLFAFVTEPDLFLGEFDDFPVGHRPKVYHRNEIVLGWAIAVASREGFVSKGAAEYRDVRSTAAIVGWLIGERPTYPEEGRLWDKARREYRDLWNDDDVALTLDLIRNLEDDNDYIEKLRRVVAQGQCSWGNLGVLVSAVTVLNRHRSEAQRVADAANAPDVVEGRQEIVGTIVSFRTEPGYTYNSPDVTKVLLRDDQGRKFWGTCPGAIDPVVGARLQLTATVQRGRDDATFGIFKRPTGATLTEAA